MRISRIFLSLIPLLAMTSCTGEQVEEELPTPTSISLVISDYHIDNVFTTLVKGFKYHLSVKSSDSGMKYEDIVITLNVNNFDLTPIHQYQGEDTNKEYHFNLFIKQDTGSDSISVTYKGISDTKQYSFDSSSIQSSLSALTGGLQNQSSNEVFYFSDYETYSNFDSENNIRKQSNYNEVYFENHDLVIANISYSSSTLSIDFYGAFIQEDVLNIAFDYEEDEEVLFDIRYKSYFIQLEKNPVINDILLFKSVQFF